MKRQLILALAVMGLVACGRSEDIPRAAAIPAETPKPPSIAKPHNYGNGMYWFQVTGEAYVQALGQFYEEHPPTFRCDYQGAVDHTSCKDCTGSYTQIVGHILHCYDTAVVVDAQSVTKP